MNDKLIAAIDLGTTKIVCLVGKMTETGIRIIGYSQRPSKGINRGEVMNIRQTLQSLVPVIKDVEEQLNIKLNDVYVGIAGQNIRCVTNGYQTNRPNPKELISEEEINEITSSMNGSFIQGDEEVLHVIPQSYSIDNFTPTQEPVGMLGTQITANFKIFVGKKNSSVYTADVINRAGLNLKRIILEPMASAKAVLSEEEMELGVAMVDIGGGTTDLLIIQNNIVRHAAVIPFGGKIITSDIKIGCSIAEKNAEQLKVEHGCCYSPLAADKKTIFVNGINGREGREISVKLLSNIIEARASELFEAVYYEIERSGYKDKLKAGLVLTGGTSKLAHIKELAQVITGIETSLGAPVIEAEDSVIEMNDPALSTAVGLIMMGAEESERDGYSASYSVAEEDVEINDTTEVENDINIGELEPELIEVTAGRHEKEKKAKEGPGLFTRLKTTLNDMFKEDDNEA